MERLELTQHRLKEMLHYEPATGIFTWVSPLSKRVSKGDVAGSPRPDNYIYIGVHRVSYMGHRLAWLYMQGEHPPRGMDIDHKDGNGHNNAWHNLRLASRRQNMRNILGREGKTSAWKGVSWDATRNKWKAQIRIGASNTYLGRFDDEREAAEAYIFAALEHHGEYARFE